MKKIFRIINSSIVLRTAILVTSVMFIVTVIAITVLTNMFYSELHTRIVSDQKIFVDRIAANVDNEYKNLEALIVTVSQNKDVLSLLKAQHDIHSPQWMQNVRNVQEYLSNAVLFNNAIIDVMFLDAQVESVYSISEVFSRNFDYTQLGWFSTTAFDEDAIKFYISEQKPFFTSSFKDHRYTTSAVYPIYDESLLVGYAMVEMNTSIAFSRMENGTLSASNILLVDDNGDILYRENDTSSSTRFDESMLNDADFVSVQENALFIGTVMDSRDWFVVSESDYLAITQPARETVLIVVLLFTVALVVVFVLIRFLVKVTQKPFELLVHRISSYDGKGAISLGETTAQTDELLGVRQKFEEMADKINLLIEDVHKEHIHARDMEFKALTNQINPHFVYNVLQLIQTKAVLSKNIEIENMINSLGRMLRYTMDFGREVVSVKEELEYITHYLSFMETRFFNWFSYDIKYNSDVENITVPKFILQPVVENCFSHAFAEKTKNGQVVLEIFKKDEYIIITVTDNGCGIAPEQCSVIRKHLVQVDVSDHIGLVNTNARIKLLCGNDCGVEIDSVQGEYTSVILTLKNTEDNKNNV